MLEHIFRNISGSTALIVTEIVFTPALTIRSAFSDNSNPFVLIHLIRLGKLL